MNNYGFMREARETKAKETLKDLCIYITATLGFIVLAFFFITNFVLKTSNRAEYESLKAYELAYSEVLRDLSKPEEPVYLKGESRDIYIQQSIIPDSQEKFEEMVARIERNLAMQEALKVENPFKDVTYQRLNDTIYTVTDEEYHILLRITEAEAAIEPYEGKIWVAHSIMNRVLSDKFPNTVKEVVFANDGKGHYQYSPISDGNYFKVTPSDETKRAVDECLQNVKNGYDPTNGALYFMNPETASENGRRWQEENLTFINRIAGHEFRK